MRSLIIAALLCFVLVSHAGAAEPYKEGEGGSSGQPSVDSLGSQSGGTTSSSFTCSLPKNKSITGYNLSEVPRTGRRVSSGYAMTHEHPTHGMAFGGNYGYAGPNSNYRNGIPEKGYHACGGCKIGGRCDHGEMKGDFLSFAFSDMGLHGKFQGPVIDSFSHLRYSTEWINDAARPGPPHADDQMKIMVAFAVESESMCELLYYDNQGGGGIGGNGYPCSTGDSVKSLERQLDNIKKWSTENSDWMQIAYTASEARAIVNAGKLAVILGVEADYAWGAEDRHFDPIDRINRYYDAGVRSFYLAHKVNSRLSGADVFRDAKAVDGALIRGVQAISGCFYYDDNVGQYPLTECDNDNKCGPNHYKSKPGKCRSKISELKETKIFDVLLGNLVDDPVLGGAVGAISGGIAGGVMGGNFVSGAVVGGALGASVTGGLNGFAIYPKPPGFSDARGGVYQDGQVERNYLSLSYEGARVVVEAMRLGMIVDLGHVSSRARTDIYGLSQDFYNYPLNALHNNPNEMLVKPKPSEYDFDSHERGYIKDTGGIFGVRLGPVISRKYDRSGVIENRDACHGTATENAKILACLLDEGSRVGYSLDFATITEGTYSRSLTGCSGYGTDRLEYYQLMDDNGVLSDLITTHGLAHIGNMKAWHSELEAVGMKSSYVDRLRKNGAEQFIRMWEKSEFTANMASTLVTLL